MSNPKKITIVLPCFNEAENIDELYTRINNTMACLDYSYDLLFIDNASNDNTATIIKTIAKVDKRVKLIINSRNFGHIRSPFYGVLQSNSDATVLIASDLQDPPELIKEFIKQWEAGYKIVLAVKPSSQESKWMFSLRKIFYKFLNAISEVPQIQNATGAGLFDRKIIEILKGIDDPYPYFRGLLAEIGFEIATVEFDQPKRQRGVTKNNFYTLYDIAMIGITNHSKVPLRLMAIGGFLTALISLIIAIGFFIAKLLFWDTFQFGLAPIMIGIFFFGAMQAFCIGMLGEYISSIHAKVRKMPLVIEGERVNFD